MEIRHKESTRVGLNWLMSHTIDEELVLEFCHSRITEG